MSREVLRVLKTEFNDKRGDASKASGSGSVSEKGKNGLPVQGASSYPSFGIKGKEPLTQDMFVYRGQQLTKSEAREKTYSDVNRHEQAHLSKAGKYATSGIHIDYDENGMATSGYVNIAMPSVNPKNLDETIKHAETVIASAEAPSAVSDLSDADKSVAASARRTKSIAFAMKSKQDKQGLGENLNYNA